MYAYLMGNPVKYHDPFGLFMGESLNAGYRFVCRIIGIKPNEQVENVLDTAGDMIEECLPGGLGPVDSVVDALTEPDVPRTYLIICIYARDLNDTIDAILD